jgi:hypothetical protein
MSRSFIAREDRRATRKVHNHHRRPRRDHRDLQPDDNQPGYPYLGCKTSLGSTEVRTRLPGQLDDNLVVSRSNIVLHSHTILPTPQRVEEPIIVRLPSVEAAEEAPNLDVPRSVSSLSSTDASTLSPRSPVVRLPAQSPDMSPADSPAPHSPEPKTVIVDSSSVAFRPRKDSFTHNPYAYHQGYPTVPAMGVPPLAGVNYYPSPMTPPAGPPMMHVNHPMAMPPMPFLYYPEMMTPMHYPMPPYDYDGTGFDVRYDNNFAYYG